MRPQVVTPPHLRGVLAELVAQEPLFHNVEPGTTRAGFEAMMTPDFWEAGASGRMYGRDDVLDALVERHRTARQEEWDLVAPQCRELAADLYLLTYTLTFEGRTTRRATIWRRAGAGWQAAFHQGTVVSS